ncbi:MAG: hypothetical protein UU73_C0003G0121 [Candidatus Daviesbacteria bacterium GW2011_GWA1_41_61]|uniref:N(4)-bis(aminopropyl)spermidine synthase C-terminal domain-containing protein n=1 Tax=Candidatus Daviesbacteria bacterium GW2011_GWA2_40_9 TaxID=1618424 RepID=A0A0G0U7K9_9BACT|nr:MAG: hypothetical protein UU26_C0003G0105 [Candidatus Daviesbacteria bacterium GW2011_GWC1_40_9]KKR83181.1 MAG: hypothetical protein UU29_C0007G0051 [Candidatus Daviesbacteria bacterium GW2011_GWA2_40_9]KKR93528.1 MAG: hypothetical protein UU44_C0002G0189 [Candidatus Daviesbacteria bacterium GW2011_GWB1_41_15]KKS14922.1 MAG: hypothetical protein UU73_C0003G0121 [Candidatus Daviesbacteria bacterium GW2011_GWA1_41_61]
MFMAESSYKKLLEVSRIVGLPIKKILDILYYLGSGKRILNNNLLQTVGVSRNVLNQVKQQLEEFFIQKSQFTVLSNQATTIAKKILGESYTPEEKLINISLAKNTQLLSLISHSQPQPIRGYDQFLADSETVVKRAALMDFFADIEGKRILFLGDDDFTSVAIAFYRKAQTITVVDIDKKILDGIQEISDSSSYQITTKPYDAREKLSPELSGKYDIVFTDPPYTREGISLFLSRAVQALDPTNQAGRIYFCYGNSDRAKERYLPIYEVIISSGLMIRWVFDKFNRYSGAESIGSASSLFICDVTPKTKPKITGEYKGNIYTER